jgi:hypothetical protein
MAGLAALSACLLTAAPAAAWTAGTELLMAERAAKFAPRDFRHQIEKHDDSLREGVLAAMQSPEVGRPLDEALYLEVERSIEAIQKHRPFEEIVQRLGQVSHYVALANNPLAVGSSDPQEARYAVDYPAYVESAQARFNVTFYGDGRRIDEPEDLTRLVHNAFARSRSTYAMLGKEYRRIDFADGRRVFDDRSTAFAVSALAFSHSVSDSIAVFRYIWLRAGGADRREFPELTTPRKR